MIKNFPFPKEKEGCPFLKKKEAHPEMAKRQVLSYKIELIFFIKEKNIKISQTPRTFYTQGQYRGLLIHENQPNRWPLPRGGLEGHKFNLWKKRLKILKRSKVFFLYELKERFLKASKALLCSFKKIVFNVFEESKVFT